MTVSSTLSRQTFVGDGTTRVFTLPFRVLAASEVVGYRITIADNSATLLSNGVDFTVSGVGAANAIVTTTTAYAATYQLRFVRQTQRLQLTDYRDNDPFPAESHEEALDRLTHIAQEVDGIASRALTFPEPESGQTLPPASSRAGKAVAFDSAGNVVALALADVDGIVGTAFGSESQLSTAGQTVFTLTGGSYAPGTDALHVFVDGFRMTRGVEYSETSSTVVTFLFPLTAGRRVTFDYGVSVTSGMQAEQVGYTAPGGTARSQADKNADFASLEDYGGVGDGTTDNLAAFNAAVAAGVKVLHATGANYYFSAGITVPDGMAVIGGGFMPSNPPRGTRFTFALSTPTCVTLEGGSNGSAYIRSVSVVREAGSIPAGSIGVLARNFYALNLDEVGSFGHAKPIVLRGDGATLGISAMCSRLFTGAATDAHVELDSVPEIRITKSRFGMNGSGDVSCTTFLRIKGGSATNPSGGMNTVSVENCQFNQGGGVTAASWVEFVDQTPSNIGDVTLFQFDTVYIETAASGIKSDSSWPLIARVQINNMTFNRPTGTDFIALNSATRIDNWQIDNSTIFCETTFAPSTEINFLGFSNTQFGGLVSITGPSSGSVASFADCNFAGGLTLAGSWASLRVKGGAISSGSFTNTATGAVDIDIFPINSLTSATPTLRFGGATTGITYSLQQASYQVTGQTVDVQYRMTLTSKGSATGAATVALTGPPDATAAGYTRGNAAVAYALNMASLSGPVVGSVDLGPVVQLFQYGATGVAALTDANFTNTSDIAMRVSYIKA